MTAGLAEWIAALQAEASSCARLEPDAGGSACRLGGLPTIQGCHEWPGVGGRPLSFVAEIDLAVVADVYRPGWLPDRGRLHFFYDLVEWPAGFDPADRGHWAVLHTPADAGCSEAPAPDGLSSEHMFPQITLSATAATSYPDPFLLQERLGCLFDLPDDEWERVEDFRRERQFYPFHQIGGHPNPIQSPELGLDCQLASNGINIGGPEGYAQPEAQALATGADDWRLLLQLDSDEAAGMMWSDVGILYFMIREQDARAGDFSPTWLLLHST